jgi:hypothetical protein
VRPRRHRALPRGPSSSPLDVVISHPAEADLAEHIYATFSPAPRPSHDVITPHRCQNCDDITSRLAPYEARRVPDSQMDALSGDLPLLGPEAFRYYLPRFIEFALGTMTPTPRTSSSTIWRRTQNSMLGCVTASFISLPRSAVHFASTSNTVPALRILTLIRRPVRPFKRLFTLGQATSNHRLERP